MAQKWHHFCTNMVPFLATLYLMQKLTITTLDIIFDVKKYSSEYSDSVIKV